MAGKRFLLFVLCVLVSTAPLFSQIEEKSEGEDFWISPGAEFAMYSINSGAYGGSFAFGYGRGACIGLRAAFLLEQEYKIITLELDFLLRFYLLGRDSISGPFLQVLGGPVIFARDSDFNVPSEYGIFSAGLSFGWRFLFNNRWFLEPMIRGGYPYIAGAGVFAGICF